MSNVAPMMLPRPDYGYIDHVVHTIRLSAGVTEQPTLPIKPGPLLSIHLQSNRPDNITSYMQNLVASLDDPSRVEVVLKIDNTDEPMNELLPQLVEQYKDIITLKFISTPLVGGFFELWRSMNDMLAVCHPHVYFLWNMNDEMAVLNPGWDTALAKYVGLFPDHLFRLRTSLFRSRNYYDFWECGFSPETSAITTKRWIDICGDWNPCLGPDSFNQCVAYYFGYHDRFYKQRVDRDIPIHDFVFAGEGAFIGMEGEALYRRARGASRAWFRLMSYDIQSEASRRSQRVMAHIWAHKELEDFTIRENTRSKCFELHDNRNNVLLHTFPYGLSRIRLKLTNFYRATAYYYYGGGGKHMTPYSRLRQIIGFLALRYDCCVYFRNWWINSGDTRQMIRKGTFLNIQSIKSLPVSWNALAQSHIKPPSLLYSILSVPRSILRILTVKGFNRGIRFHPSVYAFDAIEKKMDWTALHQLTEKAAWPDHFSVPRVRNTLLKCLLLCHWYGLSASDLAVMLGHDLSLQRFIGVPLNAELPSAGIIESFRKTLEEEKLLDILYRKAEMYVIREDLPQITLLAPASASAAQYKRHSA